MSDWFQFVMYERCNLQLMIMKMDYTLRLYWNESHDMKVYNHGSLFMTDHFFIQTIIIYWDFAIPLDDIQMQSPDWFDFYWNAILIIPQLYFSNILHSLTKIYYFHFSSPTKQQNKNEQL